MRSMNSGRCSICCGDGGNRKRRRNSGCGSKSRKSKRKGGGAQCSCIKRDFRHAERQTISKYRVLVYIFVIE